MNQVTNITAGQTSISSNGRLAAISRPTPRHATAVQTTPNYARRRFMVIATGLALVVGTALSAVLGQPATATNHNANAQFTYITVLAGQSLWQIAAKEAPEQDPRDFIASVVSLNGLTTAEVQPGQRIALP